MDGRARRHRSTGAASSLRVRACQLGARLRTRNETRTGRRAVWHELVREEGVAPALVVVALALALPGLGELVFEACDCFVVVVRACHPSRAWRSERERAKVKARRPRVDGVSSSERGSEPASYWSSLS